MKAFFTAIHCITIQIVGIMMGIPNRILRHFFFFLQGSGRKFLLSSYPSPLLEKYTREYGWFQWSVKQQVSVNAKGGKRKSKTEVLAANYPIDLKSESATVIFNTLLMERNRLKNPQTLKLFHGSLGLLGNEIHIQSGKGVGWNSLALGDAFYTSLSEDAALLFSRLVMQKSRLSGGEAYETLDLLRFIKFF